VQWIRDHHAQSFLVEDVVRVSGMSDSAFYRGFHAVTAMSTIQFQKQIRLQQARLMLTTRPGDVTGVGCRVCYESPSQFSREYRRQFGVRYRRARCRPPGHAACSTAPCVSPASTRPSPAW
jgi:AraC-like DNA-binding protein